MPYQDRLQKWVEVGDIVNIPCKVTAFGGTPASPTITLETKYPGLDGVIDVIATTLNVIQVIKDE